MKYIVTGCDGQLGGRVATNMLEKIPAQDLIFTCPDITRLSEEKKCAWEKAGVSIRQANYDNLKEMANAFRGGDRIYVVSSILNGPERVVQHKNVFDACVNAGVKHIIYGCDVQLSYAHACSRECTRTVSLNLARDERAALKTVSFLSFLQK